MEAIPPRCGSNQRNVVFSICYGKSDLLWQWQAQGGGPPLTEVLPFFNSTINEHSPGLFCHGVSQNVAVSSCYLVTFCWSITGGTCFNWSCEFPKMNEDTYTGIYPEDKAKQSNLTVAVSFGLEREAAFEHAKTKVGKRVSIRFAIMQKAISINVISHTLLTLYC